MLKSLTLASVLALAVVGLNTVPASAAHPTAAQCQSLYAQSISDPQSFRSTRDAYISCLNSL